MNKITYAIVISAIMLLLVASQQEEDCLRGRDGHITTTDTGQKMFVSHTEINDGVPMEKLCP
jgi:hypothetical protein